MTHRINRRNILCGSGCVLRRMALALICMYQKYISPLFPRSCRYYPTCSMYAAQAITRYGLAKGSWKALKRLLRCHPWHAGGYDPVD